MHTAKLSSYFAFLLLPCLLLLPHTLQHPVSTPKQDGIFCIDTKGTLQAEVHHWIVDVLSCERMVLVAPRFVVIETTKDIGNKLVFVGYQGVFVEKQSAWPMGTGPPLAAAAS